MKLKLAVSLCAVLVLVSTSFAQSPISSSKHYRNSGLGNATGRQGSATLTGRVLLNKDGSANVELTTGIFDTTAVQPGAFAKVQFKPLAPSGDALFAQNFQPAATAGGYYGFTSALLHHLQQIQLQANIINIDKNRTDVVTVVDTAKLRPDLAVTKLDFPATAMINGPVNIVAVISELNHDAGATTSVVLQIDGNNVDTTNNVYVDAGGVVSVAFTHVFTSTGGHTIQVNLTNVVPGDYDTSNNSASGSISITDQNNLTVSGEFYDYSNNWSEGFDFKYTYLGGVIYDQTDTSFSVNAYQYVDARAYGYHLPQVQLPVSFSVTESMDGVVELTSKGSLSGYSNQGYTYVSGSIDSGFVYFYQWPGYTASYFERNAGDVTYFSAGYQCIWGMATGPDLGAGPTCQPQDYYSWNTSSQASYGTRIALGSAYQITLNFTGSDGVQYAGKGVATLNTQTTGYTYNYPNNNACPGNPYVQNQGSWVYTYCDTYSDTQTYTFVGIGPAVTP